MPSQVLTDGNDTVNAKAFSIYGLNGDDSIQVHTGAAPGAYNVYGGEGNDFVLLAHQDTSGYLYGGNGLDTLAGSKGNDHLYGGEGDDYLVGGGVDTAKFLFTGGIETKSEAPTGNDILSGDEGKDALFGLDGNDALFGGDGDDAGSIAIYDFNHNKSFVAAGLRGGAGDDFLDGGRGDDYLGGGEGKDKLLGGTGNDELDGGAGNDTMAGGSGKDTFHFNTALNASANVDTITDFSHKDDTIWLSDNAFSALANPHSVTLDGFAKLSKDAFWASDSGKAHDKSDRILYDKTDGHLYYDADGKGGAKGVLFADLEAHLKIDASDFSVLGTSMF